MKGGDVIMWKRPAKRGRETVIKPGDLGRVVYCRKKRRRFPCIEVQLRGHGYLFGIQWTTNTPKAEIENNQHYERLGRP